MNKNMKKIMSLVCAVMLLVVCLSACGGSGDGPSNTPTSTLTPSPSVAETTPTATPTATPTPENNGGNQSDPGDGGIGNGYVDRWFLFGDLSFPSLTINEDSTWEMRNMIDTDGSGGNIYCEGYSAMAEDGSLLLYEKNGDEVGFATLTEDELTLILTEDFEWTFADYLSGNLVFSREGASNSFESQE